MNVTEIIAELETLADPRAVAAWTKMNISHEKYIGVNLTKLKEVAKNIGRSHTLSLELWNTGIHDAKLLATMIEESKKVSRQQIKQQSAQIFSPDLADKYISNVVAGTPYAAELVGEWIGNRNEMLRRCAYMLMAALAKTSKRLQDSFFSPFLDRIQREIGEEANWVREAMNWAVIQIGSRGTAMNKKAQEVARAIGPVEIDYGDTSCKVPDAIKSLTAPRLHTSFAKAAAAELAERR